MPSDATESALVSASKGQCEAYDGRRPQRFAALVCVKPYVAMSGLGVGRLAVQVQACRSGRCGSRLKAERPAAVRVEALAAGLAAARARVAWDWSSAKSPLPSYSCRSWSAARSCGQHRLGWRQDRRGHLWCVRRHEVRTRRRMTCAMFCGTRAYYVCGKRVSPPNRGSDE
jgi:hypothetical protein